MNTSFSYFNRVIAYSLCWLMSVQPAMATVQPGNANTQVKQAGNGVPIINIATPNSKGLSHNQYQQFNVDKQGLILNNATNKFTQTQLGGIIQNNPNLHGKGASVILNEVTGANRSQMNGYTEVAGNKANVIVTNPYGITCNGCGFINTPRVTLSTGAPQITNGEVSGFNVNQGDIIIDGQGLDATKQDYLDLISRSAKIQANIHANQLNIVTGPNEVDYKTNHVRSTKKTTNNVPKVAIDSSALGGMYAGRIALVSTEQGVGVNVGNIATTTGNMSLTADGKIVLGNVAAAQDIVMKTSQEVILHDTQHAGSNVQISANKIQANEAYTAAKKNLILKADTISLANSQVVAGVNAKQEEVTNGQIQVETKSLDANQSQFYSSDDINIVATTGNLASSQVMANHDVKMTGDHLTIDTDSQIVSDNDIEITQKQLQQDGVIAANNTVTVDAHSLQQSGTSQANLVNITAFDATLAQSSTIASQGDIHVNIEHELKSDGSVAAQERIIIESDVLNQTGQMVAGNDIELISNQMNLAPSAQVASQSNITLVAKDALIQSGQIAANNDINIQAKDLTQSGHIQANQNLIITTEQFNQSSTGVLQSGQDLNVSGLNFSNSGVVYSGNNQKLTAQISFTNMGQLLSQSAMQVDANVLNQQGTMNANADIDLNAETLTIQGETQSAGNLSLTANQINLEHDVLASGDLNLDSQQSLFLNHQLQAGNNLNISTQRALTNRGQLMANNQLVLNVLSAFNNIDSGLISSSNLGVTAHSITNQGVMQAQNVLALDSQTNITNQGTLVSMGDAHLQAKNNLSNSALIYADNDAFLLANGTISNTDADILTGRDLVFSNLSGGRAKKWMNTSGNVESGRDLAIYADEVLNQRKEILFNVEVTDTDIKNSTAISEQQQVSVNISYTGCVVGDRHNDNCGYVYRIPEINKELLASSQTSTLSFQGEAAQLKGQGNVLIQANRIINDASLIAANNNLTLNAQQIQNNSYQAGQINTYNNYSAQAESGKTNKHEDYIINRILNFVGHRVEQQKGPAIFSTIQAGNKLTITASGNVENTSQGVHFSDDSDKADMQNVSNKDIANVEGMDVDVINGPNNGSPLPNYPLPKNDKGLFVYTPDVDSHYLIETNPALTNIDEFLGSDYLFDQLGFNPNNDIKVLGDAFYDTRIINQAIFEQTGQTYLNKSIGNDIAQMQSLLDDATLEAGKLHLQAGIALTPEQVAGLTRDIVWWEPTVVNGETVLAPKLYLSKVTLANVRNGALINGGEILASIGNINNTGAIDSTGNLTLISQNTINNQGGLISSSGDMLLQALNDINNIGAKIKGGNVALISEQGSINNLTESSTNQLSDTRGNLFVNTNFGNTASIEASNDLILNAGKDINAHASNINAGGSAVLQAKESINITAANDITKKKTQRLENTQNEVIRSLVNAGDQLVMDAGKDINVHASNVTAGGSAALQAGDNINITSANDATQIKGHNMEKRHVEVVSSTVNAGNDLALNAGQDITVIGSQLAAGGDAALKAKGDITLQAQTNSDYSYLKTKEKKSFGRSKTTIVETQTESVVGADITSGGNLTLQAQKLGDAQLAGGSSSINVIGSKLTSGGDVSLSADGDITLAAQETKTYSHKEVNKSGFGGLSKKQKGSIDYATQLTGSDVVGAGSVLINSGNDINLIASGIEAGKDASLTAMNQVLVGAGETTESHQSWSKSSSFLSGGSMFSMESIKDTSKDINAQGSNITAQGNVNVQSGNTKVIGSDIEAKGNILLVADTGDVQILAAEESHNSTHKSEKLDVGFGDAFKSLTPQGMIDSVKESAKNGQIKATIADATYDAQESSIERTTHQGSNIVAGGDVTVNADNDINIEGSNLIAGNTQDSTLAANGATDGASQSGDVNLSAGNNITIVEVNDTEHTKSKETHGEASLSVTVQHQAVEVAKMVVATEKARKQAEQAQKDYKQYKKQLGGLEDTLSDLKTQLANHEPGVTKQDILELQGIIADTKDDEAWYVSNVALAGANLASKITLLAKQTAAAAQSSGTYGFDVGLEANVAASTSKNETISSTAQGSTIAGNNINIKTGQDATIQGSQVLADDELNLSADNINILASKDTQYTQSSSESGSITVSTSVYGASTGLSVNAEMSNNAATSNSTTYNNSVLVGDKVNINSTNDTTIKGGNVIANNDLNVDVGGDLTVESVQNRETASNHGMSISAGTSFGGGASNSNWHAPISSETGGDLSGGSAGFNQSQGRSSNTDTVISSLVSNGDANINVKGNTDITGSTIATLDDNGNDSGQLALNTGSLTFTDLSDTHYSSSNNNGFNTSAGINGTDIDATNNSSTINIHNGSSYSKDKTLATLGQGDITVNGQTKTGDGTVLAPELNRDINNQDKELFAVDRQQGNVDVTVDHRLLTEDGRKGIKEDFKRNEIVVDSIADATEEKSGVSLIGNDEDNTRGVWETQANKQDFFTATKNFVANPANAEYVKTLNDPNASVEQKQQAQQVLVNNIAAQTGVDPATVLQAMTEGKNQDNKEVSTKGGYIKGGDTLYVNGDTHDTIQDEANTVGHEMQHYLDDKAGITAGDDTAKQNLDNYADTMGSATEDYLGFNYDNLTDTTFGGDINHTASTNAPGSGVLIENNTNQFNQAEEHGELDNRMPPNAFGVDLSTMDSGGIQAQNDSDKAVAHVDSVMKNNGMTKAAIADYAGIGAGLGSCVTLAGCGMGLTNAAIAFSDLGEVLSQGISDYPVSNDPIQSGVISIMPDFVGDDTDKEFVSGIGLSIIGLKDIASFSKPNSVNQAVGQIINKSSDVLSLDATLENIYQNRLEKQMSNNIHE